MSSQSKTFDFVKLSELPEKPRKTGVIEFRGPYYTPVTYGYLSDLLEDWGEYVDGFKFAGGSMRLLDREKTRKMIQLCHQHDVYVSTGGFIERVIVQGPDAVDKYLEECKSLEFDMVEVSSGLGPARLQMVPQDVRKRREPLHRPFANCRVQRLASGTLGRQRHLERKTSQLSEHQMRREGPSGESLSRPLSTHPSPSQGSRQHQEFFLHDSYPEISS